MAIQLGNGTQFSLFDFRGTTRVRGVSALLSNGTLIAARKVSITPLSTWRSPHTGALYPSAWRVSIPSLHALLTVTPAVHDQEMTVPAEPVASYWEGTGSVRGTMHGKAVRGQSYTELTGFAHGSRGGIP